MAVRLIERVNGDPELMREPTPDFLYRLAEAERTIWELFIVAYVAEQRWQRPHTPFTPESLAAALKGATLENADKHPKPRSSQFELYVAALLCLGGAEVQLSEPDLQMLFWSEMVGIAVKRIRSTEPAALKARLLEGAAQIQQNTRIGFIAINVDILFTGRTLPATEASMYAEFDRVTSLVDEVLENHFGPLKHVRGLLIFGRLDGWDVAATPPRHDTAMPMSYRMFADEEDPEFKVRGDEFWKRHRMNLDAELRYLRTGLR
jgi:hypothetical protein